ncbi:PTS lactose/cellobiose transporter subunit IIA [Carnobacterium gallinarum]|uniref:PTS lactose/cellobiose transporter subunit IIA n=1 Tax=Carnobacterium gallinarum TaxID=2749 RepID=UPI000550789C|nr:PTS lactose/cellobiose transporter subunit IIA [Carnobacterium gallinarum]
MDGIELIAFQIISNVGTAKSNFIEALELAKQKDFEGSDALIKEGEKYLIEGHKIHSKIVQNEAQGNKTEFSILLMHAEDQFMSSETLKLVIVELIQMRKEYQAG